jgi:hypothetical protein
MDKFSLDYGQLDEHFVNRKVYKLADVRDRIEKVAFDVVRFTDKDSIDGLWRIDKQGDDEVIVAMYEDQPIEITASVKNPWSVISDKASENVNVFYKGEAVKKIALASVGIAKDDAKQFARNLPKMLVSNSALVRKMVNDLPKEDKSLLLSKYPELVK